LIGEGEAQEVLLIRNLDTLGEHRTRRKRGVREKEDTAVGKVWRDNTYNWWNPLVKMQEFKQGDHD